MPCKGISLFARPGSYWEYHFPNST